jgi:ribosome maturation factor RimP
MPSLANAELEQRLTQLSERAAAGSEIELVAVELRGGGKARLLRVYIDKPGGVTHADCELISQRLSQLLDEEDAMPDDSYTLEVSSPGIDRALKKTRDFERVLGRKIRLALRQPLADGARFEGKLLAVAGETITVETASGDQVQVPLVQIQKANLKFEW